jgi:succinyl-diaminopimelate desuccinylase
MGPPLGDLARERVKEIALELIGFDTTNPPGETAEAVDWIEGFFEGIGDATTVRRHAPDGTKPNLVATVGGEADHTLTYLGHTDTVPVDSCGWSHDPFGEEHGDRVYGRGATDMKGAVAAMLHTAEALAGSGPEPPMSVEFAFVSDEEVAGHAGLPSVLEAGLLDGDACVIGETTCEHGRHSVTVADKGSIWLTLEASGEPSHGSRPVFGENAVDRLYGAVESLREYLGGVEFSLEPEVKDIVTESVEYYSDRMSEKEARSLFERPTVNLGVFEGGEAVNTVPVSARAEVDVRLTAGVHTPDILSRIRELIEDREGVSVSDASWSVGTYERVDSPLVESLVSVAERTTQERVYRRSATGGGNAKNLREDGVPTAEFGLGTDTAHAADEYTTVDALAGNAEAYTRLPYALAEKLGR